ncbi:MAG TPA: ATP-binding protein [Kofleriaceae bacterium]|jgi:signal transduction histidine kinase|nr:ATP-binding protein [Kofleriaceae bacterium]
MTDHIRRILVVDDNRAIHDDVRKILRRHPPCDLERSLPGASRSPEVGFEISSAYQGIEGVELVRAAVAAGRPYAVVLVDLRVPPGIDGLHTIARMWEIDRELQVVICTAHSDAGWEHIVQRFGATDRLLILNKPFDLAEVSQLVLALTEKWRLGREASARVAELARSRADLAASLTLARAVQEATADGLLVVDSERRVITASRRFFEMWNLAPDSHVGSDAGTMLRGVLAQMIDPEAVIARVDHLYSHPEEAGNDEIRLKDGRIMERWTSPVRSDTGKIDGRLWIFRDVTERRRLELDRAVVTERMAAMGRLAAGVGHEINNPLTYALGNIEALLEPRAAQSAPPAAELTERLQEARDGLARIRVIVRDLQTLARADDKLGEVDLKQVIEQAIQIAGAELRHRAPIVRNYRTAPPITGSPTRLGQVFLNLIINAAQAIPEGQATSNRIEVSIRDTPSATIIEVTDTGSGIAPEHLERIFDPFFTTKEVGAGTGLGLSISREIVASHRGTLTARSKPGTGTTMTVTLPHTQRIPKVNKPPTEPAPLSRRARVLVIDDEPLIARILQRGLSRHQVTVASEARDALERIQRGETYDVILCDLMMPDLSGIDVHEYLTREYPEVARRLVFMTGGAFTSKARQFLSSVTNDRLDKPFSLSQVNKVVERHLATAPP